MSNILVVESINDKYFIEALIEHINISNIEVSEPICRVDDFECIGGIGNLEKRLYALKSRVAKEGIDRVGIIFDADSAGIENRKNEIEKSIDKVFSEEDEVGFSIYIMNLNGYGELETVLRAIKKRDSQYADCLNSWRECLSENGEIRDKDFDKFWVQIYQRYDCCSKQEAKQASRKCGNEASFSKDIWDYDSEILSELRDFLINLSKG